MSKPRLLHAVTSVIEGYNFEACTVRFNALTALTTVQLAGANTTELGCGAAQCRIIDGFPLPNSILLVCNYAPE